MKKLACIKWNFGSKNDSKTAWKWKIKIGMRKNIICHVNYNHVQNGTIPKYVLEPHRITRKLFLNMHDFFVEVEILHGNTFFGLWNENFQEFSDVLKSIQKFWTKIMTLRWRHYTVAIRKLQKFRNFERRRWYFRVFVALKTTQLRIMPPDKHDLS